MLHVLRQRTPCSEPAVIVISSRVESRTLHVTIFAIADPPPDHSKCLHFHLIITVLNPMELRSPAPSLDVVFASPSPPAIKRRRTIAITTPTSAPVRAAAAVSTATVHIPLWQKMAVGGVAGVVGTVSVFPIDLIKTRVQLAPSTAAGTSMGITTVVMDVCSRYGLSGLYRGMPATALATLPEKAIKLGVNDYLRDVFCGHDRSRETTKHQMAAGACTAVVQVLAT